MIKTLNKIRQLKICSLDLTCRSRLFHVDFDFVNQESGIDTSKQTIQKHLPSFEFRRRKSKVNTPKQTIHKSPSTFDSRCQHVKIYKLAQ